MTDGILLARASCARRLHGMRTGACMQVSKRSVERTEDLLDAYFMQVDHSLSRLNALKDRIEAIESLVSIDLDHRRNELTAFDLARPSADLACPSLSCPTSSAHLSAGSQPEACCICAISMAAVSWCLAGGCGQHTAHAPAVLCPGDYHRDAGLHVHRHDGQHHGPEPVLQLP